MRYLRVPPTGGQVRAWGGPVARNEGPAAGTPAVSLSVGNFVENFRDMLHELVGQARSYVWGQFLTIEAKENRKSRKKAEK
jgi:hypothetical protein